MFTVDFQIIITYQSKQKHKRLKNSGLSSIFKDRNVQLSQSRVRSANHLSMAFRLQPTNPPPQKSPFNFLTPLLHTQNPGGWYSPKFRIGVCRERSQTLTLSKDKENEN